MKSTTASSFGRPDPSRQAKKPQKGKKTLPTMAYFKSYKNVQPVPPSPAWVQEEANALKPALKPIFEDTAITPLLAAKFPVIQRIQQIFPSEALYEDPDIPLSFINPEVDPPFSSALFLCLSKGSQFFDSGTFRIFPPEVNPAGKHCIKMYENGSPIRLFFDDRIGCHPGADDESPPQCAFLRHTESGIMFPTFLHKAFLRFIKFEPFTSLDVITAFTGFVHYEIPLEWPNLQFWFGRPDSLVSLYIRDQRNEGLGGDRLFHILDVVDLDQHRKFVKLQCPGAQWRGRFSGFEEDTRHWTNQIRVILEIDPETAATAGYFWMIYEDLVDNFDCIMAFSPVSSFPFGLKHSHVWVPKEAQFYAPPPPKLLHCNGAGRVQICVAPLLTTAQTNDLKLVLRKFAWNASEAPVALELRTSAWVTTSLDVAKPDETFELEVFSRGGYVLQMLSLDTQIEFQGYDQVTTVTAADGDLPFYVCLDEYATSIFPQRFELIGKVVFNLDQPGNVAFALFVTNEIQKGNMAVVLFNNDNNDANASRGLRSGTVALTPNKRGYTMLIFGLYTEAIMQYQPVDLVGKWRLRMFSDVPLSDVVDATHLNYTEVDGECVEMDETHQINRNILTGSCEAVVVLETSLPLSLTLVATEEDVALNTARGIGWAVLPVVHIPGEKEPLKLIIKGIASEAQTGFQWKLRIFSTGAVNCKEDTGPAEKTAAAIAAWEKKRATKPVTGKKTEAKAKGTDAQVPTTPPEIDPKVLHTVEGEPVVLTEAQIEALLPAAAEPEPMPSHPAHSVEPTVPEPGEELRDQISALAAKMNEAWEQYEAKRTQVTKLFTPTPPKIEEK
jgi:hypothetical protein